MHQRDMKLLHDTRNRGSVYRRANVYTESQEADAGRNENALGEGPISDECLSGYLHGGSEIQTSDCLGRPSHPIQRGSDQDESP